MFQIVCIHFGKEGTDEDKSSEVGKISWYSSGSTRRPTHTPALLPLPIGIPWDFIGRMGESAVAL